jgi:CMP-N,N'-diacetyllegionaminic acid synthase
MIKNNSILAIIPARMGSKGLPQKNIKMLCDKPLIAWTIEAARNSKYVDEVIVTTDGATIAEIAEKFGAYVPFLRPAELASDVASTFDVVKHVIDFYNKEQGKIFDYVVLLEPTSPLREGFDIDFMLEKLILNNEKFDAIVSLGETHLHPSIMKRIVGDQIESFDKSLAVTTRRQDNEVAYFPYGVAYIIKSETLLKEKSFYPLRTTHYLIKRYQCIEIDDIYDFLAVENIMKYEWSLA